MGKKITEGSAIDTISGALDQLNEDIARLRVIDLICQKYNVKSAAPGARDSNGKPAGETDSVPPSSFKDFMSQKKPKDGYQKLACLAYYLEKFKEVKEYSVKELRSANADAKQITISNISAYLKDATSKYGFFASSGKGKKFLTTRGEAVVVALPDQEKVKEVLKEHHLRKKNKARKPKNK